MEVFLRPTNTSAMSRTSISGPDVLDVTPSVIMFKQNGHAVAKVRAPVPAASAARTRETRCAGGSSNHMRPPPAPQQKVFAP